MKRRLATRPGGLQVCLIALAYCCLTARATALDTIIDFGDPTSYRVLSSYQEDGYSLSVYRMEVGYDFDRPPHQPLQGGLANVQGTLMVTKDDGGLFQCLSVDLRTVPYNSAGTYTGSVGLEGITASGSRVYQSVSFTQGWTTFVLPSSFAGLWRFQIDGGYVAVDNIVLRSVPEPRGYEFIVLLALLFYWVRQKRRGSFSSTGCFDSAD